MSAPNIIPFRREPMSTRTIEGAAGTGASHRPPAGAQPFPPALEALAAEHVETLRGGLYEQLVDLIERAHDERRGYAHRVVGTIADVALDGLLKTRDDLDGALWRMARQDAAREAKALAEPFLTMTQDAAVAEFRYLTRAQREAVSFVLSQPDGGA